MSYDSLADVPTWILAVGGTIGLGLVFGHVWLTRRDPMWLGAIVPAAYTAANIAFAVRDRPRVGELVGTALTLVLLLIIWWAAEDTRKRQRGETVGE